MWMPFRAGPPRDCTVEGHDFRLFLADRIPHGRVCIHQDRPATMLVTACSGCGVRAE